MQSCTYPLAMCSQGRPSSCCRQFIGSIRETDASINKDIFSAETLAAGSYVYFSWNSE